MAFRCSFATRSRALALTRSICASFFASALSTADQTYLNANKNADGVAFRAKDANGDGRMDYEFLTSTGVQLFYGLP